MTSNLSEDRKFMQRALALAARGRGRVEPNPMVGAVIVKRGQVCGEGFHEYFGGPHAEVHAMQAAGEACKGATLYVTLEPCTSLHKKTPPCCDAVIAAEFERVVIGARDQTQDPAVPRLEAAGIAVACGVLEPECKRLIAPFVKLRTAGKPYVIAKWAMTADGKLATVSGDSKWISSDASRELVHQWRNEVDAVLVGIGTVRADDPLLTCRMQQPGRTRVRNPQRIILDANASLPLDSQLVRSVREAPLLVACLESAPEPACQRLKERGCEVLRLGAESGRVDVDGLLIYLGKQEITNLMVEGGSTVLSHLFERRMVDEVRIFIAPRLIGGQASPTALGGSGIPRMSDAIALAHAEWTRVGDDMLLVGIVRQ